MFIRIMLTARERMEYTKKCIESIEKYTESDWELFIFDDRSSEKLEERYAEYAKLVKKYKSKIAHIEIFPPHTRATHDTFGKAVAWNHFGYMSTYEHGNQFSEKDKYFDFLVLLDNDIFLRKSGWELYLAYTWKLIDAHPSLSNTVKIVTQAPGGIMGEKLKEDFYDTDFFDGRNVPLKNLEPLGFDDITYLLTHKQWEVRIGNCGGSGFWMVKPSYFTEIGFLPLKYIKGKNKGHDILSWQLHRQRTNSNRTAVGLWQDLALHIGHDHSVCNYLTTGQNAIRKRYEKENKAFRNMTLDEALEKYDIKDHQRW